MNICDINIPGLPTVLMGHIVPSLTITSLIDVCPLCKVGCKVVFYSKKCDVTFDSKVIYMGTKTQLLIYGCCQFQLRCVLPQDPPSCHNPAPI
jgi:hypothetical protein